MLMGWDFLVSHPEMARVGKSTFLNFVVAWLNASGLVDGLVDIPTEPFQTANGAAAHTKAADVVPIPLIDNKLLLLIDSEGG